MSAIRVLQSRGGLPETLSLPALIRTLNRALLRVKAGDLEGTDWPAEVVTSRTGSWTPGDVSGAGLTFTNPVGRYTRHGNIVFASFALVYPATANGASAAIGPLPFTSANTSNGLFGAIVTMTSQPDLTIRVEGNSTILSPYNGATGGVLTNAALSGDTVRGTAIYEAV